MKKKPEEIVRKHLLALRINADVLYDYLIQNKNEFDYRPELVHLYIITRELCEKIRGQIETPKGLK